MWLFILFSVLIVFIFTVRIKNWYKFVNKVSKICFAYDKQYTYKDNNALVEKLTTVDYHKNCEWSAYKKLYFNGPNPLVYLFSFEKLDIYKIYNNDILNKILNFED